MKRLHDPDALRACAMLLGVLLHVVFYTIPFRYFRHHVLPGASNAWALPYFHLVLIVTGILLVAWTREVRYSWIGTLFNGKRERPGAESSLASYSPAAQGGR